MTQALTYLADTGETVTAYIGIYSFIDKDNQDGRY
jgi:hypothetical protein